MKWFALVIFILAAGAGVYVLTQGQTSSVSKQDTIHDQPADANDVAENEHVIPKATSPDEVTPSPEGIHFTNNKPSTANDGSVVDGNKDTGLGTMDPADRRRRKRLSDAPLDETSQNARPSDVTIYQNPSSPSYVPSMPAQLRASPSGTAQASASGASASATASSPGGVTLGGALISGGFITTPAASSASASAKSSTPASTTASAGNAVPTTANKNLPLVAANIPTQNTATSGAAKTIPRTAAPMYFKHAMEPGDGGPPMYADKYSPPPPPPPPPETPPADFVGLYLSPKSVPLPASGSPETEKKTIAAYTQKSGFSSQDKITVEISKECEITLSAPCDTTLPEGGPSLASYLMGSNVMREDLVPETKAFDIGTTTIGTYKDTETGKEMPASEVSMQIDIGKVPGRYSIHIANAQQKSYTAVFEVTAAVTPQSTIQMINVDSRTPLGNAGKNIKVQTPP